MSFQFDLVLLCSSSLLLSIHHHPVVTNHVDLGALLNRVGLVHMSWTTDTLPFSEPSLTAFSTSICFHGSRSFCCACSHLCIVRATVIKLGSLSISSGQARNKCLKSETFIRQMTSQWVPYHCCPDKAPPAALRTERWLVQSVFPCWECRCPKATTEPHLPDSPRRLEALTSHNQLLQVQLP